MINGLADKTDGGIGAWVRGKGSSYMVDAGGLDQVRPGMFSGSSSILIGGPGENSGLELMIV